MYILTTCNLRVLFLNDNKIVLFNIFLQAYCKYTFHRKKLTYFLYSQSVYTWPKIVTNITWIEFIFYYSMYRPKAEHMCVSVCDWGRDWGQGGGTCLTLKKKKQLFKNKDPLLTDIQINSYARRKGRQSLYVLENHWHLFKWQNFPPHITNFLVLSFYSAKFNEYFIFLIFWKLNLPEFLWCNPGHYSMGTEAKQHTKI